jgi:hypothetical protein
VWTAAVVAIFTLTKGKLTRRMRFLDSSDMEKWDRLVTLHSAQLVGARDINDLLTIHFLAATSARHMSRRARGGRPVHASPGGGKRAP